MSRTSVGKFPVQPRLVDAIAQDLALIDVARALSL